MTTDQLADGQPEGLELARRRTGAVGLGGAQPAPFAGAAEVVGWFGALQAQD